MELRAFLSFTIRIWSSSARVGKIQRFHRLDDWVGPVPTLTTLTKAYVEESALQRDSKTKFLMSLTGKILCGDHTFKVQKPISSSICFIYVNINSDRSSSIDALPACLRGDVLDDE